MRAASDSERTALALLVMKVLSLSDRRVRATRSGGPAYPAAGPTKPAGLAALLDLGRHQADFVDPGRVGRVDHFGDILEPDDVVGADKHDLLGTRLENIRQLRLEIVVVLDVGLVDLQLKVPSVAV